MHEIIGIAGAALILLAFSLHQFGKLTATSVWYDAINLIGSGLLLWYSWRIGSYPFLLLNAVWFIVSAKDLFSFDRNQESE